MRVESVRSPFVLIFFLIVKLACSMEVDLDLIYVFDCVLVLSFLSFYCNKVVSEL